MEVGSLLPHHLNLSTRTGSEPRDTPRQTARSGRRRLVLSLCPRLLVVANGEDRTNPALYHHIAESKGAGCFKALLSVSTQVHQPA